MSGKMSSISILSMIVVIILSVLQITKGNDDGLAFAPKSDDELAFAPVSAEGWLPKPFACLKDFKRVPYCVKSVEHFKFKTVTRECCSVLLDLPDHCLGDLFPEFLGSLEILCDALGIIRPRI
ncbi:hypothetical protein CARUB_v10019027mg [Capsella rubella]|uniref:Prolamin-like domain-containing protein n=1 Tax=Capsella rubella TaxID=81985 RepID=R0HKD2_9BRAS|nr:hypothetical protein CARUB_v10019027mg [Capsella rubella]